jgi:hypothetical protein
MPGTRSGPAAEGRVPNTELPHCPIADPASVTTQTLPFFFPILTHSLRGECIYKKNKGTWKCGNRGFCPSGSGFPISTTCGKRGTRVWKTRACVPRFSHFHTPSPQDFHRYFHNISTASEGSPVLKDAYPVCAFPSGRAGPRCSVAGPRRRAGSGTRCRCQDPVPDTWHPVPGMGRLGDSMGPAPESRPYCPTA